MNRKGFILSTYIYMLLVFFLLLLVTMLTVLNNTKLLSNKLKEQSSNTSGLLDKDFSFILLGEKDLELEIGKEYNEPGFKIQSSQKKDLSNIVKVVGSVDVNTPNTYKITYSATYNGITKQLTRNVTVKEPYILAEYIEDLLEEDSLNNGLVNSEYDIFEWQNGEYVLINSVYTGIRYAGAKDDVKNKIYFNCKDMYNGIPYGEKDYKYDSACEIWRIIGVFDTKENEGDTETKKRVKIVRDKVLDEPMMYDENENVWESSSLKTYLNEDYYNSLSFISKGQIDEVIWYTGMPWETDLGNMYELERSSTWKGKIGLIYPSDFGFSGTNCEDEEGLNYLYMYDRTCGLTSNWLTPETGEYWTISPYEWCDDGGLGNWGGWGGTCYMEPWYVSYKGWASYWSPTNLYGVRPSLYLNNGITIIGGDGDSEPYKLKL